ncbi:pancreatic triacylglycerol lipase-like [Phymastichus coffea]|uniref:pancreatic triacylglycerol lipase-like n=1 Tax=Phymastichus coffea TaxID=108790 RepID=UPI00273C9F25|nr:pancreatic triacylglycerol lipase-like [Phymastichus coffea]
MESGSVIGKNIDFNPKRRTTVIVHGLGSNSHEFYLKTLVDQLLLWRDMNVIVLDWQSGSSLNLQNLFFYPQTAVNSEYAAIVLKNLFVKLRQVSGVPPRSWRRVHFIGHSLGAHVVGQAAEMLKRENFIIDRVTGLDPAEPCFRDVNSPLRMRSSNARLVDVIHTDGARTPNERFGLLDQLGHVDFYVNGGSIQPGCQELFQPTRFLNIIKMFEHVIENGSCHHNRAFNLFLETVIQDREKKCRFWAHPWSLGTNQLQTSRILNVRCNVTNCVEMGINAELWIYRQKVSYYVETTGASPYCNVRN